MMMKKGSHEKQDQPDIGHGDDDVAPGLAVKPVAEAACRRAVQDSCGTGPDFCGATPAMA